MALQGAHGSPFCAVLVTVTSKSRCFREEAAGSEQPTAASVSDAAGQEDPAKRGAYPVKPSYQDHGWTMNVIIRSRKVFCFNNGPASGNFCVRSIICIYLF